jgi:chromosome segregation ATPase
MAREATITQEQVNEAADRIRSAGAKPTARAVREDLGSGSMATVLKHLQVWQSGQVRQAETPVVLPAALQRALVEFIGQEVATAKVALESDLVIAQQANTDLIAESERQAASLDAVEHSLESLREERAELQGRLSQMTTDLSASQSAAEAHRQTAEATRTELAKSELRLEGMPKLETEVSQLKSALEAERRQRSQAEQSAAVAVARLDKTEAQVEDLQARLTRAEGEARTSAADSAKLREQASSMQANFEVAVRDGNQARDEARRAEAEAAELRGQLLELRSAVKPEVPAAPTT